MTHQIYPCGWYFTKRVWLLNLNGERFFEVHFMKSGGGAEVWLSNNKYRLQLFKFSGFLIFAHFLIRKNKITE